MKTLVLNPQIHRQGAVRIRRVLNSSYSVVVYGGHTVSQLYSGYIAQACGENITSRVELKCLHLFVYLHINVYITYQSICIRAYIYANIRNVYMYMSMYYMYIYKCVCVSVYTHVFL